MTLFDRREKPVARKAAVVFFIPRLDSLMGLLLVLGLGAAMAAWLSSGSKYYPYGGWQMGLAVFMTILQEAHPVTELDVLWNRFAGIVLGVVAMRLAFAFPTRSFLKDSSDPDIDEFSAYQDHK